MAQVEDPFAGHVDTKDPRTLVFGAAGCVFPTMPAFHYRAMSENATGDFAELNGDGILLPLLTAQPGHFNTTYGFFGGIGALEMLLANKVQNALDRPGYRWQIIMQIACQIDPIIAQFPRPFEKCNRDVPIGALEGDLPEFGTTGSTFILRQVVWNETMPPG